MMTRAAGPFCLAAIVLTCASVLAQDLSSEAESLLSLDVPVVHSTSKRPQARSSAASSVVVITRRDIERSGRRTLAEVLRTLGSLDVRQAHASQHVLGIRGFVDTGHVLVTIDGNNAFMWHANHIFVDWIPLGLEEIERIEIIKGPAGLFYGGNAFSGVVNIMTRGALQSHSPQFTAGVGNSDSYQASVRYGGQIGQHWDFVLSGGAHGAEESTSPDLGQTVGSDRALESSHYRVLHGSARLERVLDHSSRLVADLRVSDARNVISRVCNPQTWMTSVRIDRPGGWIRLFASRHMKDFWGGLYEVDDRSFEAEAIKTFRLDPINLMAGGYGRTSWWEVSRNRSAEAPAGREDHRVSNLATFVEGEFASDRLSLVAGGRLEHYTDLSVMHTGRASLILHPRSTAYLRFTVSTGRYLPSLFQQTNEGRAYPFALGNPDLREEHIRMLEAAAGLHFGETDVQVALFRSTLSDLIDNSVAGPMRNVGGGLQRGLEVRGEHDPSPSLRMAASYRYLLTDRDEYDGIDVDPQHKALLRICAERDDWSASMDWTYTGAQYEIYMTANPVFGQTDEPVPVAAHTQLNGTVTFDVAADVSVWLSAQNLLDSRHFESNAPGTGYHSADPVGRRLLAGLTYQP